MSKTQKLTKSIFIAFIPFILFNFCQEHSGEKDFLKIVLGHLNNIKSASYYSTELSTLIEDTSIFSQSRTSFIKMMVNPSDTLVGARTAVYNENDTTKIMDFYDGKVWGTINRNDHFIKIDSFRNYPYPFRLVYYPLYIRIREIIKYSLTTKDSIQTDLTDYGDSARFSLRIFNKHVYFSLKPMVIKNEYIPEDEISRFDIWITKSDYLPYRLKSKWFHTTVIETSYNPKFNELYESDFVFTRYFPDGYKIIQVKRKEKKQKTILEGRKGPAWELKDLSGEPVLFSDIQSKVLMLNFTGLGCGPCHHSLPFLKQLAKTYQNASFKLLSIETWTDDIERLKRYRDKNKLNYELLIADERIKKDYDIKSVPVFIILDGKRNIRNVIKGYEKGTTDKEILTAIDRLFKESL